MEGSHVDVALIVQVGEPIVLFHLILEFLMEKFSMFLHGFCVVLIEDTGMCSCETMVGCIVPQVPLVAGAGADGLLDAVDVKDFRLSCQF